MDFVTANAGHKRRKPIIIAEAGVNHNGDLSIAKQMVDAAKECGADIVKFQTADPDLLVIDGAPVSAYQRENMGRDLSQKEMIQKLMLSEHEFVELAEYCKKSGIEFLSTPFDIKNIYFLNTMQRIWKIPSGEITNVPYLLEIARTGKDIILSTGMSTMEEVEYALSLLKGNGSGSITLLHCTTQYPAPFADVNLNAMVALRDYFGTDVGYSDHTLGIEVSVAAVAMGAAIIEKHFTLDRTMKGPDHNASLEPPELKQLVNAVSHVSAALGSSEKNITKSEIENKAVARKSIVASKDILMGEELSEDNITTKRPGTGLSPVRWFDVIGSIAIRNFRKDEMIEI